MFRNYLTIALRNIVRHKLYSFINIAGLAIGLTSVILVILFVRDELSYDKWVPDSRNLYRVELTAQIPDRPPLAMAVIPYPMMDAMRGEIPGVTGMTRLFNNSMTLMSGDRQFRENVVSVDPDFFQVIRLRLTSGDPGTVFRQPQSLVLSQSAARKYFGNADPVGRVLTTGRSDCTDSDTACQSQIISLKVTGVMADLPHNTQLAGEVFMPNTSIADRTPLDMKHCWFCEDGFGFVRLAPGTDPQKVAAGMGPALDRSLTPELRRFGITTKGRDSYAIHLTPFAQVRGTQVVYPGIEHLSSS